MLRLDYHDQLNDVIEKVNRELVPFGISLVDDGQPHDGFCLFAASKFDASPKWTATLPAAAGFYWFRDDAESNRICVVQIMPQFFTDSPLVVCGGPFGSVRLSEVTYGEWCGPIAPPS